MSASTCSLKVNQKVRISVVFNVDKWVSQFHIGSIGCWIRINPVLFFNSVMLLLPTAVNILQNELPDVFAACVNCHILGIFKHHLQTTVTSTECHRFRDLGVERCHSGLPVSDRRGHYGSWEIGQKVEQTLELIRPMERRGTRPFVALILIWAFGFFKGLAFGFEKGSLLQHETPNQQHLVWQM